MSDDDFTFEFDDIPKEKYKKLESLLFRYMDGELSRESYVKEVEKLLQD